MQSATLLRLLALLLVSGVTVSAQNSVKRKSPTSKFYVADVNGFSQVNTGEKIEDLTEKSVFDADGTVIETKPESDNAIVMSNGVGIYFKEDTKLAVKRFIQEPFQPNRTDLDSEPSVSQTRNVLSSSFCMTAIFLKLSMAGPSEIASKVSVRLLTTICTCPLPLPLSGTRR